jgi:hypothetical protein
LAKGDVIVSVKYREVFSPAIFLGDEMLEIGHWKNADFHPFSTISHKYVLSGNLIFSTRLPLPERGYKKTIAEDKIYTREAQKQTNNTQPI